MRKISEMSVKNWVEAAGGFLILCGIICIATGFVVNFMNTATQAQSFATLKSYWKTGLSFEIAGIVMLVLSSMFTSNGRK